MNGLIPQVTSLLTERAHLLLDEAKPPHSVDVVPQSTVLVATVGFDVETRRVVAKPLASDASIRCPDELCRIHDQIRAQGGRLAERLPRFYRAGSSLAWYLMEYVEGRPLDDLLDRALRRPFQPAVRSEALLSQVGELQAALHRIRAAEVGLPAELRRNDSFLPAFEVSWESSQVARLLPRGLQDPHWIYDRLPAAFFGRSGDRVLAGDLQPKNVLAKPEGGVVLIDLDYIAGNPAIGLSQFLVGLDRLTLRRPFGSPPTRVASWKQAYLAAYFRGNAVESAEDLLFFYPWMLVQNLQDHAISRPRFRAYLRRFYGRLLRDFLLDLDRHEPGRSPGRAVRFFTDADTAAVVSGPLNATSLSTGLAGRTARPSASLAVPLQLDLDGEAAAGVLRPVSAGIPFPKGLLDEPGALALRDESGWETPLQASPLARWSDGSIRWLLIEALLGPEDDEPGPRTLVSSSAVEANGASKRPLRVIESPKVITIETGPATFQVRRGGSLLLSRAVVDGRDLLDEAGLRVTLTDLRGSRSAPRIESAIIEARGPWRASVRLQGHFEGRAPSRFTLRLDFFAGSGLIRARFTLHNPSRARHPGGLWDLGDPGSIRFRDFSVELPLAGSGPERISWRAELGDEFNWNDQSALEIYQDSSGGENWQSRVHQDHSGRVPCQFRGYRVRAIGREHSGLRASPTVVVEGQAGRVSAAIPEFWQQFPKALEVQGSTLRARLFPGQFGAPFELQGGERKTHTLWLDFAPIGEGSEDPIGWVHQPPRLRATPEWYADSGALAHLLPAEPSGRLEKELSGCVEGPRRFEARRETIDEYGWRHYGEIHADHESAYYPGELPVISHYNNQYDLVLGMILQYLRTGDGRWFDLFDPLARHVVDIDIYHTNRDKSAYNGGLFWHTDHYRDAATCTHRAFSRSNRPPGGGPYGGGPSSEHNYTTGLLHYYYLTGEEDALAAVLGLADWVIAKDDGQLSIFGWLDPSATGSASRTAEWNYHGPGRGAGNSINALLDGWLASGSRRYLRKAEELIRRTIHPADDIEAHGLLNTETRWSYTVHLSALARYLALKEEAGEIDRMYAYTQAALLHYARWMLEKELPYFERPEQLEYPTETWAAQEFRKANVLRLAASHADEPLRSRLLERGEELADRAWADLLRFESRDVARAVAILMREGVIDAWFRARTPEAAMPATGFDDFGPPQVFIAQKDRVRALLRSPSGLARAAFRLAGSLLGYRPRPSVRGLR